MVLLYRNKSVSILPSVMFVFPVEEKDYSVCTPKVQHVMHPHPQVCKGYLTSCHPHPFLGDMLHKILKVS